MTTLAKELLIRNPHNFPIKTDSAVSIFTDQLKHLGVSASLCKKPPGSVNAGLAWLRSLIAIYIDPRATPLTYKEFEEYTYKILKDGTVTDEPIDKNNHSIDAVRYALVDVILYP